MEHLAKCRVAVFGIGGVGGYVCEALARSGIGAFDLIDHDKVCLTNINRQIIATGKTVGKYKTDVMKERILDINPEAKVTAYQCFFLPENASDFPFEQYDYVVDAMDTVTAKIELVMQCQKRDVPVMSSMGAGNKLDPTMFRVADIYKTNMDPLAKVMRRELKKRGVKKLKVVYSEEKPVRPPADMAISCDTDSHGTGRRDIPGSTAFVPSVAGLIIAGEVVRDLAKNADRESRTKKMTDQIVPATEKDREQIMKLYKEQIGREFCAWDEDYPSEETIDFDLSRDALFVMKENDAVIAAISIEIDEDVDRLECWDRSLFPGGELARLAVTPSMQGRGIAGLMLQHGMNALKERGYKSIHFLVNKHNVPAIRAYAKFGFHIAGECHMYDQDFMCYEKELDQ